MIYDNSIGVEDPRNVRYMLIQLHYELYNGIVSNELPVTFSPRAHLVDEVNYVLYDCGNGQVKQLLPRYLCPVVVCDLTFIWLNVTTCLSC